MQKILFYIFLLFSAVRIHGQCTLGVFESEAHFKSEGNINSLKPDGTPLSFDFPDITPDCEVTTYTTSASWLTANFYNVDVGGFGYNVGYFLLCEPNLGPARSTTITFTNKSGVSVSVSVTQDAGLPPSKLIFTYDLAGNQVTRRFETSKSPISAKQIQVEEIVEVRALIEEEFALVKSIKVFPNPTKGLLKIEWDPALTEQIHSIRVVELSGSSWEVNYNETGHYADIDLTNYAMGTYVIQFDLLDSRIVTKKIIKN